VTAAVLPGEDAPQQSNPATSSQNAAANDVSSATRPTTPGPSALAPRKTARAAPRSVPTCPDGAASITTASAIGNWVVYPAASRTVPAATTGSDGARSTTARPRAASVSPTAPTSERGTRSLSVPAPGFATTPTAKSSAKPALALVSEKPASTSSVGKKFVSPPTTK